MNKIIIIGANEFQNKLIIRAKELGYETHVLAWEDGAIGKRNADFFYPISITEKEEILELTRIINPIGVCSIASDLAVPTVNYVANRLNLPSNSDKCTLITTNKYEMRSILSANNLPSPKFQLISSICEIDLAEFQFPLIIKPIDRSGSRGITKITDVNEIEGAINNSKKVSFSDKVLIEEFVEGIEYSVEFISQNGVHNFLQLTEKFTSGSPHFIERGHLAPARIDKDIENKIIELINDSLNVLEVKNGASHSEIKVNKNGEIKIIEIASRMGGDYIGSDMVQITTNYDYMKNIINISINKLIDKISHKSDKMALVGFIFNEGDKINFDKLKEKYPETIKEYFINENIRYVEDSSSRNGYYILEIEDEKTIPSILEIMELEVNHD